MSIENWVFACVWLAAIITLVMLALFLVALADPARRHRAPQPDRPRRR